MNGQTDKLWTKDFILITLSNLLVFLNLHVLLPTFPSYVKEEFQANDFTVSLVISLFAVSAIITRFLAAGALQKGKINQVLFLGLTITIMTTAGYYWCGTLVFFLLMRIIYGAGFGMLSTTVPTMVTYVIPSKRLGEGIGYFGLSTSLALSLGPMIGLFLLGNFGFGTLIFVSSLLLVFIFPLLYFKKSNPSASTKLHKHTEKKTFIPKAIIMPVILNFLLSLTYSGILSFIALFGQKNNIPNVGYFFLFNALATIMIRPISGRIFDRKGHNAVLIPGSIMVFFGLILLTFSTTTLFLIFSALVYGLGFGMIQPTVQAWMIKIMPKERRGTANSLFYNSLDLGIALGSMLLGMIAMKTSYITMYRVSAFSMVLFLLIILSSLVFKGRKNDSQHVKSA